MKRDLSADFVMRGVIYRAVELAFGTYGVHQPVSTAHILLSIVFRKECDGYKMLNFFGLNFIELRTEIEAAIEESATKAELREESDPSDILFSLSVNRAKDYAAVAFSDNVEDRMDTARLIGGMMAKKSIAGRILGNHIEINLDRIRSYLHQHEG